MYWMNSYNSHPGPFLITWWQLVLNYFAEVLKHWWMEEDTYMCILSQCGLHEVVTSITGDFCEARQLAHWYLCCAVWQLIGTICAYAFKVQPKALPILTKVKLLAICRLCDPSWIGQFTSWTLIPRVWLFVVTSVSHQDGCTKCPEAKESNQRRNFEFV